MQLEFCEPYPAAYPDYHVIEVYGALKLAPSFHGAPCEDWRFVSSSQEFAEAIALARNHCVRSDVDVWVIDRNDADFVCLRVTPSEYWVRRAADLLSA